MRVLFTVHTYFQLLISINLKKQFFNNDVVDIVISDVSSGSEIVKNRLDKYGFFNRVFCVKIKDMLNCNGMMKKTLKYLKADLFYKKIVKERSDIVNNSYDIFLFYQLDIWTDSLYYYLKKINKHIEARRMQETFNSYLNEGGLIIYSEFTDMVKNIMRYITFKPIIRNEITTYYMFEPNMILFKPSRNYSFVKMDKFNSSDFEFMNVINYVFDYDKLRDTYEQKYIYFESIEYDEFDAIRLISDIVGKENFMVKIHPRSKSEKYSKYGIQTNKNVAIPWEVILLNKDFNGKVFITTSSQAVFGFLQFTEYDSKGILIYKYISASIAPKLDIYLQKLIKTHGKNKLVIPEGKEELISVLKE